MIDSMNFYKCKDCDSVFMEMGKPATTCRDGSMELLSANSTDAATEKHVPVVSLEDGMVVVRIGSVPHPMTEEHYIEWVFIESAGGGTFYNLNPGDVPEAIFPMKAEEVEAVYIYCNLHGLWKAKEPVLPNNFVENNVACSPEFPEGCMDATQQ